MAGGKMRAGAFPTLVLALVIGSFAAAAAVELDPTSARAERMAAVEAARFARDFERLDTLRQQLERRRQPADDAARYDAAYALWRSQQLLRSRDRKDERYRRLGTARILLEPALAANDRDVEVMVLLGAVMAEQAERSVFSRIRLGRRAYALLDRAVDLAPENPRARLQRAVLLFFTPALLGGGPDVARGEFERVRSLFDARPAPGDWPSWGAIDAHAWLGRALAAGGDAAGARAVYRAGLALEPDAAWIRDVLLPKLDE